MFFLHCTINFLEKEIIDYFVTRYLDLYSCYPYILVISILFDAISSPRPGENLKSNSPCNDEILLFRLWTLLKYCLLGWLSVWCHIANIQTWFFFVENCVWSMWFSFITESFSEDTLSKTTSLTTSVCSTVWK